MDLVEEILSLIARNDKQLIQLSFNQLFVEGFFLPLIVLEKKLQKVLINLSSLDKCIANYDNGKHAVPKLPCLAV